MAVEQDLQEVRMLARQVGVAEERVDLLLQRVYGGEEEMGNGGGPRVLLASAGEGTLELLLAQWLGAEAEEAMRQAGMRPLVIGREPERVRPRTGRGNWAVFRSDALGQGRGHVVAVATTGALTRQVSGELSSAGAWDTAVVVTRAAMPLPQTERELIRSLCQVVVVMKVLVVVVPGELSNQDDANSVEQYARGKAEEYGFAGGRSEGVWFWWLDGKRRHPQAVASPGELLASDARAVAQGRELMLQSGLAGLLKEIEQKAASAGVKPLAALSEEDLSEMEENLTKVLTGVRRRAETEFREAVGDSDAKLRDFVVDQILAWDRQDDLAGVWLTYVENQRPGAKAGLFQRAKTAVAVLALEPAVDSGVGTARGDGRALGLARAPGGNTRSDQVLAVGAAVGSGVVLWALTSILLAGGIVAAAAAAAGAVLGFAVSGPLIAALRQPGGGRPATAPSRIAQEIPETVAEGKVRNFAMFEHELRTWLRQHIRTERMDVAGRCQALAQRLELNA